MGWGEGREPACRFRQLSLAADPVAAAGLVPRDRDVDEALEEVALGAVGPAPHLLEHLVRGEVLAALDQLEPVLVAEGARHVGDASQTGETLHESAC